MPRGESLLCSISANGTFWDAARLTGHSEQYVPEPPAGGDVWEQLLGRLHRQGQEADEVVTWVPRHTPEVRDALERAVRLARYVQDVTGGHQKLLAADLEFETKERS